MVGSDQSFRQCHAVPRSRTANPLGQISRASRLGAGTGEKAETPELREQWLSLAREYGRLAVNSPKDQPKEPESSGVKIPAHLAVIGAVPYALFLRTQRLRVSFKTWSTSSSSDAMRNGLNKYRCPLFSTSSKYFPWPVTRMTPQP